MPETEQVLGSTLKAGDVVRQHGYRWHIDRVVYDPMTGHRGLEDLGRWYLYAHALGAEELPSVYRDRMELGLREDLHWTREVPENA